MLREKVNKLDAVLFTHSHKDHNAGLDDIRSYNFRSKRPMEIFCSNDVLSALKMVLWSYESIQTEKPWRITPHIL